MKPLTAIDRPRPDMNILATQEIILVANPFISGNLAGYYYTCIAQRPLPHTIPVGYAFVPVVIGLARVAGSGGSPR